MIVVAAPIAAQRGWDGYDLKKPLTLSGPIRASSYQKPRASVDLLVSGVLWHVVLAPPAQMKARGVVREMLQPGLSATVSGYPSKTVKNELRADRITIGEKTTNLGRSGLQVQGSRF
jgi:hypothetical protein